MQLGKYVALGLTVLAFTTAGMVTHASAQNLLVNPGFESGDFSGWQLFGESAFSVATVVADNGPSAPGTNAASLDNQSQAALALVLKQSTPAASAVPGTVDYSVDLKVGLAGPGGVSFVQIFAEQENGGVIGGSGLLGPFFTPDWFTVDGSFEAPAGTDFLTIEIQATTGAVSGSTFLLFVDNASLEQDQIIPVESASWGQVKSLYR